MHEDAEDTFAAEYRECRCLYEDENYAVAERVANELVARWLEEVDLSLESRKQLADAMWIACSSAPAQSWGDAGVDSEVAMAGLNQLMVWLRAQPEREFRGFEAWALCERMRWYGRRIETLESLEQVNGLLADLDDPAVTAHVATRVVEFLSVFYTGRADGLTDEHVARMERLAVALADLRGLLDPEDAPDVAALVAALLLAEFMVATTELARSPADAWLASFAALGDAALAECDRQIERQTDTPAVNPTAAIAGMLLMKTNVLLYNDEHDLALETLTELIDRYGTDDDPATRAVALGARALRNDMLLRSGGGSGQSAPRRSRFHDDSTTASDPGGVTVSDARLRRLCPELYGLRARAKARRFREIIIEHMEVGDSRAAVVVRLDPLLVAAYSDELDCVAMLRFPPDASEEPLEIGSRLLTVNTYWRGDSYAADLDPGPLHEDRYVDFHPIIADFICADSHRVEHRKNEIAEEEWTRAQTLGTEYCVAHPGIWRDGSPSRSHRPAATHS